MCIHFKGILFVVCDAMFHFFLSFENENRTLLLLLISRSLCALLFCVHDAMFFIANPLDDLNTEQEKALGNIVKKK